MASGVGIPPELVTAFSQELKLKKQHRYILYKLNDAMTEVEIECKGCKDESFDCFKEKLVEAEALRQCRYGVFDLEYINDKGAKTTKIIFVSWAPDSSKVKNKMVHASSKDAFKKALGEGISKEFQASDLADLDMDEITKELNKMSRV